MANISRNTYNDDHATKDHCECGLQYVVHKLPEPKLTFSSEYLSGEVNYYPDDDVFYVIGRFALPQAPGALLKYWAANPILRNYSYAGSGLPYPNPETAYENTPNQGYINLDPDGSFNIKLDHPSGYYVRLGKILLKPHIHLKLEGYDQVYTITLADNFPYRSLKNLPNMPNRSILR